MVLNILKRVGGACMLASLALFLSCATSSSLDYAKAKRSIEAARQAGAETSPCGSRNYYEALNNFKIGKRYVVQDSLGNSISYLTKARKSAEASEEQTVFCTK